MKVWRDGGDEGKEERSEGGSNSVKRGEERGRVTKETPQKQI